MPRTPAIENTKFKTQYVISREGSGVGTKISREKKIHTVTTQKTAVVEKNSSV